MVVCFLIKLEKLKIEKLKYKQKCRIETLQNRFDTNTTLFYSIHNCCTNISHTRRKLNDFFGNFYNASLLKVLFCGSLKLNQKSAKL